MQSPTPAKTLLLSMSSGHSDPCEILVLSSVIILPLISALTTFGGTSSLIRLNEVKSFRDISKLFPAISVTGVEDVKCSGISPG